MQRQNFKVASCTKARKEFEIKIANYCQQNCNCFISKPELCNTPTDIEPLPLLPVAFIYGQRTKTHLKGLIASQTYISK